jgi:hypothetical protein
MGKEAHTPTLPSIPDPTLVAEVVRLADAAEAERYEQRPAEWPECRADLDSMFRPTPARDALVAYLRGQPHEVVAGLYGLYRCGDLPRPAPAEAMRRYRTSYAVATMPMHREHGAGDLAGKGPLAHGLRRGLTHLGLPADPLPPRAVREMRPANHLED